ncbi:MAG: hypothetical protein HYT93_01440 [Parcubacteria group bacterium]|nr:hypothetical protein [Parcubacteria group bacterium]
MQKLFSFKILFFFAVLMIGIVYSVLPHFVRYETLTDRGERYIPLTITSTFDHINIHAARYRDIVDGAFIPGEMDTYEHKGGPILWPILSATILFPFFLPFESIFPGIIITEFIFPILIFISLFLVLYRFTQHRFFSLVSAYAVMLFPQLSTLLPPSSLTELKALIFQFIPFSGVTTSELNFLARDSYIPSGPFFVLMFYFVYRALTEESRQKTFIVLGGIFYGLLFYLYFYFWVFATIFLGVLFLFFVLTKNYSFAKTVFLSGIIGVIVSVPFWINQYNLSQLPSYDDIMARMGIEEEYGVRWFLWKTYILHTFMAGAALYIGQKLSKKTLGFFLAALSVTGIIVYNINVITGFSLQSDHWGNKVFLIVNGMILPTLAYYGWVLVNPLLKSRSLYLRKIFSVLALISILFLTTHVLESTIKENIKYAANYTVAPALMEAYEWLNKNTPKDSVVMTPSIETNIELAAYTHNRIFQARSQNNLLSKVEVLDRFFITYKFLGISPAVFAETIESERGVFNFFTAEYNSRALDSALRPYKYPVYKLPPDVSTLYIHEYETFIVPQEIPYHLDYIFVGPREEKIAMNRTFLERYEKLYDTGVVIIYRYQTR